MNSSQFWQRRNVLLTGHTGFKGGWMSLWLGRLGAKVSGLALAPEGAPNFFTQARVGNAVDGRIGDIRDPLVVDAAFDAAKPEIVIHMAAQPLVLESYRSPVATFATNVMGTVHVLDAARRSSTVRTVLIVTTDKCYENREWHWPYREADALGGHDCYSSSKACAELATAAFVKSFFHNTHHGVATVRAGNVIGGGDWSANRLIPDAARAFLANEQLVLRNPTAVRPWQHVLEPLGAYLAVAERLYDDPKRWEGAWNVGPEVDDALPVSDVISGFAAAWGTAARWQIAVDATKHHEAHTLRLDTAKIRAALGWRPRLRLREALQWTAEWYKDVARTGDGGAATLRDIERFEAIT